MITGTLATDWLAVAARADHQLWDRYTPWLITALLPLTALAAAGLLTCRQAQQTLPTPHRRPPDTAPTESHHAEYPSDWLDDLAALATPAAMRIPAPIRPCLNWLGSPRTIGFLRAHITALTVTAAFLASLALTSAEAIGEHWSRPLLFLTGLAIGTGGFTAASLITNALLHIAVPEQAPARTSRPALRHAAIAGLLALPTAAVLRDEVRATLGLNGPVTNVGEFATITFTGAALATALVFAISTIAFKSQKR